MGKGYWIARVDVADLEAYKSYIAANAKPFREHGAHYVVRGGAYQAVQGESRARNVVIEFPSYQAALDCWHSADYQAAVALRAPPVSEGELLIIEGYDGPQPV